MTSTYVLGIDFGGVLSKHDGGDAEHKNVSIDMDYAVEELTRLKELGHTLYIISFCGKTRAKETSMGLKENNMTKLFDGEFYVSKREYKKYVCKYLGCDFMIDDREFILEDVKTENPNLTTVLFGSSSVSHKSAKDWKEVTDIVLTHEKSKMAAADSAVKISSYCYKL
jgi:hypothetical protein